MDRMDASSVVRLAVIGVGQFGQHHVRLLSAMPGVKLVALVDPNRDRAAPLAAQVGARYLPHFLPLLGEVDAVCIVVPTSEHLAVAEPFLQAGVATFIEKPIAVELTQAAQLHRLAARTGTVLQVGHIERFNPAWRAFMTTGMVPAFIEVRRFSPYPFRSLDINVVYDVMIHDLDLVLAMNSSRVVAIRATGGCVLSPTADRVETQLDFADGTRAVLAASRIHHQPVRQMRLWDDRSSVELDFLQRTCRLTRLATPERPLPDLDFTKFSAAERQALLAQTFCHEEFVDHQNTNPLADELGEFIRCVRGETEPTVGGEQAYQVIQLAEQITQALGAVPNAMHYRLAG